MLALQMERASMKMYFMIMNVYKVQEKSTDAAVSNSINFFVWGQCYAKVL